MLVVRPLHSKEGVGRPIPRAAGPKTTARLRAAPWMFDPDRIMPRAKDLPESIMIGGLICIDSCPHGWYYWVILGKWLIRLVATFTEDHRGREPAELCASDAVEVRCERMGR